MADARATYESLRIKKDNEKKLKGNVKGTLFSPTSETKTSKEAQPKETPLVSKPNTISRAKL